MPGLLLLLWNEPTVFAACLCLTALLLRRRHAAVLHLGQEIRILQELLRHALAKGV